MDENYLELVRKSLYEDAEISDADESVIEMPRTSKKIRFSFDKYNSENVFAVRSEKLVNRQATPFKNTRKKKKEVKCKSDDSFKVSCTAGSPKNSKTDPLTPKLRSRRKRIISSSSSSDSFDDDFKHVRAINPSISELENFQSPSRKKIKTGCNKKHSSIESFNLNAFFDSREFSFNDSMTEPHSGIDDEFLNDVSDIDCNITSEEISYEEQMGDDNDDVVPQPGFDEESNSDGDDQYNCLNGVESEPPSNNSLEVTENKPLKEVNSFNITEHELQDESISNCVDVEYYNMENSQLVVLKKNQSVSFHGVLTLKVLHGRIEILGYILDQSSNEVNLYSPRGSALLRIKNITNNTGSSLEKELSKIIHSHYIDDTLSNILINENSAVFKCSRLIDAKIPFIEKYIAQQVFPTTSNCNSLQVIFEPKDNWNEIKDSPLWDAILKDVKPTTKLMLTGGKGVGKSTFLRYAVNRLLNKYDKVRVVDLDPGQSEFTIPGCISLVTITEPIFGPNYTHLKATDVSFLSSINIGYEPEAYIKTVKSLMERLETYETIPTLINYMGFVQGLGLKIISSAISFIQPTDVVQIQSKSISKNFKAELTVENIQENCDLFVRSSVVDPKYILHKIPAMNDENNGWSMEPRQVREMCVLAYLSQMMPSTVNSLTSCKLPMYEVSLTSIKLLNLQGNEISPAEANGNLVSLCSSVQDGIFDCLGHGVIRGIDMLTEKLVLLLPIEERLEDVHYLVVGSVLLPPSVYMTPDDVRGFIPYVMKGDLISLGQITKRSYLPVTKK